MRPFASKILKSLTGAGLKAGTAFAAARGGNIAMSFAILAVPMTVGIGVGIDYTRSYNVQSKMQADLDAALIAAVKEVDDLETEEIQTKVKAWFAAQADTTNATYTLENTKITVDKSNRTIKAVASGTVPTTLMRLANINSVKVSVVSSVAGPATSFLNVYIVIDKSSSMLLAATSAGQTSMRNKTGCNFACHEKEGGPWTVNGVSYDTHYKVSKAMGIQLRADVAINAAEEVLDMIAAADPSQGHIKVGLYSIGSTATQIQSMTASTTTAKSTLKNDNKGLTSATSINYTYFDKSLPALKTLVGDAGDGSSASKPLKLVLILTDGVQSQRSWVSNSQPSVSPLNPNWCSGMKTAGATIGVLYTEYLPITDDWGYNATVGKSMATSAFTSTWGGTMRAGVSTSTTRRDYLPYALSDCATSSDLFLAANSPSEIENGLKNLFEQYLTNVRLTQ